METSTTRWRGPASGWCSPRHGQRRALQRPSARALSTSPIRAGGVVSWDRAVPQRELTLLPQARQTKSWMWSVRPWWRPSATSAWIWLSVMPAYGHPGVQHASPSVAIRRGAPRRLRPSRHGRTPCVCRARGERVPACRQCAQSSGVRGRQCRHRRCIESSRPCPTRRQHRRVILRNGRCLPAAAQAALRTTGRRLRALRSCGQGSGVVQRALWRTACAVNVAATERAERNWKCAASSWRKPRPARSAPSLVASQWAWRRNCLSLVKCGAGTRSSARRRTGMSWYAVVACHAA